MKFIIREDKIGEGEHILKMIAECFINENAALLAEILRSRTEFSSNLSFVAEVNRSIVGYILFNPVQIRTKESMMDTLWLEPVCVLPAFQGRGIGSALIRHGIEAGRRMGFNSVFVTGDINYYSKFGFKEAANSGIGSSLYIPSESFLTIPFTDNAFPAKGKLIFPEEIFG